MTGKELRRLQKEAVIKARSTGSKVDQKAAKDALAAVGRHTRTLIKQSKESQLNLFNQ